MEFRLARLLAALVPLLSSLQPASGAVLLETQEPSYSYQIYTGPVGQKFASPQAVLDAYQAMVPPTEQARLDVFNPRPDPGHQIWVNGLPVLYLWDYAYTYPQSPLSNYGGTTGHIAMDTDCPADWSMVQEHTHPANPYETQVRCERRTSIPDEPSSPGCRRADGEQTPFPIAPATQEKIRAEIDWADAGPSPLTFERTYRSSWGNDARRPAGPMGKAWAHNHSSSLHVTSRSRGAAPTAVAIFGPGGAARTFAKDPATSRWSAGNSADTLQGDGPWTYRRADDDLVQTFDREGRLLAQTERNGWTTTYAYANGRLSAITNPFGRTLGFHYNGAGQLTSLVTPDARVLGYTYDSSGRLARVAYPDATARGFLYENTAFPHALTGILDERGARWATFAYDSAGRAISSELAGGVARYQVSYPHAGAASIIDPLQTSRHYSYGTSSGRLAVTYASLPAAHGDHAAARRTQDAHGLVTSELDFHGVETATTWDPARRLPTSVTRAAGLAEARTTAIEWHPRWALPVRIEEAGRTTAFTYDAQGRALTRTVTPPDDTGKAHTTSWTYNPQGLVATETAANGAQTRYTYDAAGNILSATDALGHLSSYTYDSANRMLSHTAADGLVTRYTYDPRDRLLSRTVGGQQTTTLSYNPTGTLATLSLPDGLAISYTYDAAHRLTGWRNNRGERGSYTLDAIGNRSVEQVSNSAGDIAWKLVRSINSINRLSARTEGAHETTTFHYDPNGDRIQESNPLGESTQYLLDSRRRLSTITDPTGATARLHYNALDALTQATDFKGVATRYSRNAQGDATAEQSPDIGSLHIQRDALGLPIALTDALGHTTRIVRDPLGRALQLTDADGRRTDFRYHRASGQLAGFSDPGSSTDLGYDPFGRLTGKLQQLASGLRQELRIGYTPAGQRASLRYPDGSTLGYRYDATGRLVQLDWNGQPLVTQLQWNALGQPTGWNWAFVRPTLLAQRRYDSAGRLAHSEFAAYSRDPAGRISHITQQLHRPGDADPSHNSIASGLESFSVGYDRAGRLSRLQRSGDLREYAYDANGNRIRSMRRHWHQGAWLHTEREDQVDPASNRMLGFTQSQRVEGAPPGNPAATSSTRVDYTLNARGDRLSDGLRSFRYDARGRFAAVTTGAGDSAPTTRYAHNALGQRVFKTEPLYPPPAGDQPGQDPGALARLAAFFAKLLGQPTLSDAERLGWGYLYDEDGSLLAESGTGGANSTGSTQIVYLPTAAGPMPIVLIQNGQRYAIHADHLHTPRLLTNDQGQAVWQWAYSGFGEEPPTTAATRFADPKSTPNAGTTNLTVPRFNLRFPGQVFDEESGLFYNYFRTYDPRTGTYIQNDWIGLEGGWNRKTYANNDPLKFTDPLGLWAIGDPLPQPMVDFGAGLGDGLLLGSGGYIRDWADVDGGVDPCSNAYDYGAVAALAAGGGRMAYAGLAKAGSVFAASGAQASAFRSGLKSFFRGGVGRDWRPPNLTGKTDTQLRASAGKTNFGVNAYGAGVGAAGGISAAQCGCPK